jgi:hypothetical protein
MQQEQNMKRLLTFSATVACALALTACGGGGDDSTVNSSTGSSTSSSGTGSGSSTTSSGGSTTGNSSGGTSSSSGSSTACSSCTRPDEGIWEFTPQTNTPGGTIAMFQTVILNDGTFWTVYGTSTTSGATFSPYGILHGSDSVNGNSVSGTFQDDFEDAASYNGSYSGSVSAQNTLNLAFSDPSNIMLIHSQYVNNALVQNQDFSLQYDPIYSQPASLSTIAGTYLGTSFDDLNSRNIVISGSNVTISDTTDTCATINGTLTPHGNVGVFDITFTANGQTTCFSSSINIVPPGTYTGILFQTSGTLKNYIEIAAFNSTSNNYFFFMGSK